MNKKRRKTKNCKKEKRKISVRKNGQREIKTTGFVELLERCLG